MSGGYILFSGFGSIFVMMTTICCTVALRDRSRRPHSYKQCLRNIDALERECFPEWFESEFGAAVKRAKEVFEMRPGAVWQVDSPPNLVYIQRNPYS